MATEAQIAANRVNGIKGGVKTEAGKAISRLNARKHGIFALALTEEDAQQLRGIEEELAADLKPVGVVEEILVEKLALTFMRMRRCARMEAEHYRVREQCSWVSGRVQRDQIIVTIGNYDIRLTNQFLRLSHELERLRQMRTSGQRDDPHGSAVAPLSISQIPQISSNVVKEEQKAGEDRTASAEGEAELPEREMKNEPNSAAWTMGANLAKAGTSLRKVDPAQVEIETKNEPNLPIS